MAPGCPALLQDAVRPRRRRKRLVPTRAAAHVRVGEVGFRRRHRADRRRRGPRQLYGHKGLYRHQIADEVTSATAMDAIFGSARPRLLKAIGSAVWLPKGRISLVTCTEIARALPHVRVAVISGGHEEFLDGARRHPPDQVEDRARLVVRAARARSAEWLLADHRAGGLVVDVEVAR